jgi:hypothetical protein
VNSLLLRRRAVGLTVGLCAILLAGCVVPDGGVGYPGYYEPPGVVYGGWGPGYLVGPIGGGGYRGGRGGFGGGQHAFRAAPASRAAPSIPGGRGGGGGSHGGGGGHGGGRR